MRPYAGVDYNLNLFPLQSRLQHIYHGQPYARVDLNPVPESTFSPSQGLWIWSLSSSGKVPANSAFEVRSRIQQSHLKNIFISRESVPINIEYPPNPAIPRGLDMPSN
jgi:hypothetical protein